MVKRPDLRDVMSFRMGNRTRRGRASLTIPDELMLGCSIRMFHEFFGREPDYLSGVETQVHDVAWPSIIIAYNMEIERSAVFVGGLLGGMTGSRVIKHCMLAGFDFGKMLSDQYEAIPSTNKLAALHGVGHEKIRKWLRQSGVEIVDRNGKLCLTQTALLEVYREEGSDLGKTADRLGVSTKTVRRHLPASLEGLSDNKRDL